VTLAFIAAAALCLAIGTAEIARRLNLTNAMLLTALPWGLLTAGGIESGAPLWALAVAVAVLAAVIAGRIVRPDEGSS
jgi:hypothetical protein